MESHNRNDTGFLKKLKIGPYSTPLGLNSDIGTFTEVRGGLKKEEAE